MTMLGGDVGGTPAGRIEDALHQHLMTYDHRGEVRPMLVTELPSRMAPCKQPTGCVGA